MAFADRFVSVPDLFPARLAGEHWGTAQVSLDFLGATYSMTGLTPGFQEAIEERFGDLVVAPDIETDKKAIEFKVFRSAREDFHHFDLAGWDVQFDFQYHSEHVKMAGYQLMGFLSLYPRLRVGLWTCSETKSDFILGFANLLRVASAYALLENGGVLIHSAALSDGYRSWLFPGHSGAGKSTLSRLAAHRGWEIYSDDLNAIVPTGKRVSVQQVPFAGDFGRERLEILPPRPLEFLCKLRQSEADAVAIMETGSTFALLVACAPFVNCDPFRIHRLEENLLALVEEVPGYVLDFSLDGQLQGLVELVEERDRRGWNETGSC